MRLYNVHNKSKLTYDNLIIEIIFLLSIYILSRRIFYFFELFTIEFIWVEFCVLTSVEFLFRVLFIRTLPTRDIFWGLFTELNPGIVLAFVLKGLRLRREKSSSQSLSIIQFYSIVIWIDSFIVSTSDEKRVHSSLSNE